LNFFFFRFDTELAKVNDALKMEKQQREKVQRERDESASHKYTVEQELKVTGCIVKEKLRHFEGADDYLQ
jgi:hypothetical protein